MQNSSNPLNTAYILAVQDFQNARRRVAFQKIFALLRGQSSELLSFEDVRNKLKAVEGSVCYLTEISLEKIVGSVGRYEDFTRTFLPRKVSDQDRWAGVMVAMTGPRELPPIEVYKVGEAYFVVDGNHRVSIARQLGWEYIRAHVREVHTRVPLTPDVQPDELFLMAEYADFLDETKLDEFRPGVDLSTTVCGQHGTLLQQIEVQHFVMSQQAGEDVPYTDAVTCWYDAIYLPTIEVIREHNLLRDFPGRTETDLFLWILEYQATLHEELGWEVDIDAAIEDLATRFSPKRVRAAARMRDLVLESVTPPSLVKGPSAGKWRERQLTARRGRLFPDILVAVDGTERGWDALAYGLAIAQLEGSQLHGLHVLSPKAGGKEKRKHLDSEFQRQREGAGVKGTLAFERGTPTRLIPEWARWADLVVLPLHNPPGDRQKSKLETGFRTLAQRCPVPLLVVPEEAKAFHRALLAYDGSPKSQEALYMAAYLASFWEIVLVVVTVEEKGKKNWKVLSQAQEYLETYPVEAAFVQGQGSTHEVILRNTQEQGCDLIILGGYSSRPIMGALLGSTVDQVLRGAEVPVLICK